MKNRRITARRFVPPRLPGLKKLTVTAPRSILNGVERWSGFWYSGRRSIDLVKVLARISVTVLLLGLASGLLALQRARFQGFGLEEDNPAFFPAAGRGQTQWAFVRLRYGGGVGVGFRRGGRWAAD